MTKAEAAIATQEPGQLTFEQLSRDPDILMVEAGVYTGGGELVDKETLIGREFIVVDWKVNISDKFKSAKPTGKGASVVLPNEFVSVTVALADPMPLSDGTQATTAHVVFNDGGVGIRPVLERHEQHTGRKAGLWARKGLRVSTYDKQLSDGSTSRARTFYFD